MEYTLKTLLRGATVLCRDTVVLVLLLACTRKIFVKRYGCFILTGSPSIKRYIPVHMHAMTTKLKHFFLEALLNVHPDDQTQPTFV